jgi:hypothetical protein
MHLSIPTAAFALASLVHGSRVGARPYNATADAAIHLYTFDATDCNGEPQESPFEMKTDQCVNLRDPRSAKSALWKGHHTDWIEEINNLHIHCKLELFGQDHCMPYSLITVYGGEATEEQPRNFNKCLMPARAGGPDPFPRIKSAKFSCVPIENPEHLCTKAIRLTSWSIEPTYGSAVPVVYKATLTATLQVPTPTPSAKVLAKRGNQPGKGVWMLHPWSTSWICYSCYLKQADYTGKMKCKSGIDYPIDCGPTPPPFEGATTYHTSTTSTSTAVSTTHSTSTAKTTAYVRNNTDSSNSDNELASLQMKRGSWHIPVKFSHPFQVGKEACADAEWQKRGQPNTYIEIQHVHVCDHNDNPDSKWIGLPPAVVHTLTATKTSSRTVIHTTTSISTFTARHDQL